MFLDRPGRRKAAFGQLGEPVARLGVIGTALQRQRGIAMTIRDDLASSHVPPIDWAELLVSGILVTMIAAGVLVFIR